MATATLPQAPIIRKRPDNLHDWTEQQVTQATRTDQQRPEGAASLNTIAYYAHLDETEGYALRTTDNQCFFVGGKQVITLTNADIPRLVLHGQVDIIEAQQILDTSKNGFPRIATSRKQEVS